MDRTVVLARVRAAAASHARASSCPPIRFFVEKVRDVVGLYLNPPEHALVLCVDEKSQMQALERTQPVLPMGLGLRRAASPMITFDTAPRRCLPRSTLPMASVHRRNANRRHRHQEFLSFLRHIEANVPPELDVHLICDNYATHKHPRVRSWLARRPRFHLHFTPTYSFVAQPGRALVRAAGRQADQARRPSQRARAEGRHHRLQQRLTWSGIALHGGVLPGHPASHGCIRLPYEFAGRLFDVTKVGMRVIIAPGDAAPVTIAHPILFPPTSSANTEAAAKAAAAEADEAASKVDQARLAAATATREAARASVTMRVQEIRSAKQKPRLRPRSGQSPAPHRTRPARRPRTTRRRLPPRSPTSRRSSRPPRSRRKPSSMRSRPRARPWSPPTPTRVPPPRRPVSSPTISSRYRSSSAARRSVSICGRPSSRSWTFRSPSTIPTVRSERISSPPWTAPATMAGSNGRWCLCNIAKPSAVAEHTTPGGSAGSQQNVQLASTDQNSPEAARARPDRHSSGNGRAYRSNNSAAIFRHHLGRRLEPGEGAAHRLCSAAQQRAARRNCHAAPQLWRLWSLRRSLGLAIPVTILFHVVKGTVTRIRSIDLPEFCPLAARGRSRNRSMSDADPHQALNQPGNQSRRVRYVVPVLGAEALHHHSLFLPDPERIKHSYADQSGRAGKPVRQQHQLRDGQQEK